MNDLTYYMIIHCDLLSLLKIGILFLKDHLVQINISISVKIATTSQKLIKDYLNENNYSFREIEVLDNLFYAYIEESDLI